jgi:hypothetical protein
VTRLSDEEKTYIVQSLACFDAPSAISTAAKQDLGLEVSRQGIEAYDPNKRAGRALAARWRVLFAETRKAFLEDTAKIAISHRAVRLRALDRMATRAEGRGNYKLAMELLRQAAEEMGDVYTNRRELSGNGGALVQGIVRIERVIVDAKGAPTGKTYVGELRPPDAA